jgi:hypothetical protein
MADLSETDERSVTAFYIDWRPPAKSCNYAFQMQNCKKRMIAGETRPPAGAYSTVTDLARFRGWSTSQPRRTATW